jgi:hypothetical protein
LQEEYLLKLAEANGYSSPIMESFRGKVPNLPKLSWKGKLFKYYQLWKMNARERRFHQAFARGQALALQEILKT